MGAPNDVTVVITACNRPLLLERTLRSFLKHNRYPIAKYVIVDDAGPESKTADKGVNDFCRTLLAPVEVDLIYNSRNLGQIESVDVAYARVSTQYIFHCEEDWEFYRPGFIERSLGILQQDPTVVTVWLRAHANGAVKDNAHPIDVWSPMGGKVATPAVSGVDDSMIMSLGGMTISPSSPPVSPTDQYYYMKSDYYYEGYWSGFTFNPGLRRTSDYLRVAPFVQACLPYHHVVLPGEIDVARVYRALGMRGAIPREGDGYVAHIGWGQHVPRLRDDELDRVDFYIGESENALFLSTDDYVKSMVRVLHACGHATRVLRFGGAEDLIRSLVADRMPRIAVFLQRVPSCVTEQVVEQARLSVCLLNTEQLTRRDADSFLRGGFYTSILDYSRENLRLMEQGAVTPPLPVPRLYLPYQRNEAELKVVASECSPEHSPECSVVFVGWVEGSDRRRVLLERIRALGISVTVLDTTYGAERDAVLFRHKVLINVHYDGTFNVHEHLRVDRCVYAGMVVVTEPSVDVTLLPLRDRMVFADYDALPARVAEVLADYDATRARLGLGLFRDSGKNAAMSAQSAAEALHASFRRAGTAAVDIRRLYRAACDRPSDINEHLPTLYGYASRSARVAEMGVRGCVSTWALLAGLVDSEVPSPPGGDRMRELVCVDIAPVTQAETITAHAKRAGVRARFLTEDSATVRLVSSDDDKIDFLFIDTWHVYGHLRRELEKHHANVTGWIAMHDTQVDAEIGESVRCDMDIEAQARSSGYPISEIKRGLRPAIEEFLAAHPEWETEMVRTNNNGLTVLRRRST